MAGLKELMKAFLFEEVEPDETETAPSDTNTETAEAEDNAVISGEYTAPVSEPEEPAASPSETIISEALAVPVEKPVYWEDVQETETVTQPASSIFDGLDMESISEPEKTKKRAAAYKYDRKKLNQKVHRQQVETSDYTAIISPIFGNVGDSEKEYDSVHDAINLPKPDADFEMTRVLSPMYGSDPDRKSEPVRAIPMETAVLSQDTVEQFPAVEEEELPAVIEPSILEENQEPVKEAEKSAAETSQDLLSAHLSRNSHAKNVNPSSYKKPSKKGRR